MMQYLPDDFDMEKFDFRQGANAERLLRKRKTRKLGFDFGKDFKMAGNNSKPSRQTKKSRESLPISVLHNPEGEKKRYHVKSEYLHLFFRFFRQSNSDLLSFSISCSTVLQKSNCLLVDETLKVITV